MRFVKTPTPTNFSVTTSKGVYRNSRGKRTHHERKSETPVEFVGIDGEAETIGGVHRAYVLLGVGDKQIENPNGLDIIEIFEFLYQQYKPNTAFVGFFLGYDFGQWLKTLPEERAAMLLTSEGRAKRAHKTRAVPHPVEYKGWQFDLLGMKRLKIRPKDCDCKVVSCQCKHRPWMFVCDVGSFFQTSFLNVINPAGWEQPVVTDEEYAIIERGKAARDDAPLDDDMRYYNRLENELLARVMRALDTGFTGIGVRLPPAKWFGPGQAAQEWLKNVGAPKREEIEEKVPVWALEAARMSYFGGWFEIMMHGIIPGETHEYDINSAYPSVIARLPCLLHGGWMRGEGKPPSDIADFCLVYADVLGPGMPSKAKQQYIGAMLHRDSAGRITRPMATSGWYWYSELRAAQRCGIVGRFTASGRNRIRKWVAYRPCECRNPLADIAALYQRRLDVGKTSPLGKGAKLTYNSSYGKFAQSIGEPLFANPVYASMITAGCRTQILDAIATHPKGVQDVAMVATDAVYFLHPHPGLDVSSNLGAWDHKIRIDLTLFKPGVYWDRKTRERIASGKSPNFKARGVNAADFGRSIAQVDAGFMGWKGRSDLNSPNFEWPKVEFESRFRVTSPLQALRQGEWGRAGAVSKGDLLVQDSWAGGKRDGLYADTYEGRSIYRSNAHYGMVYENVGEEYDLRIVPSVPYEKRFGMEDPWSDEYKAQFGDTTEGNSLDIVAWILKGE